MKIKPMDRKTMLMNSDLYGTRGWFKWYHTTRFIRFQLVKVVQSKGRYSYIDYLFWGHSARSIQEKYPPLGHDIEWSRK